ncbi:MAG: methyltransferase domain-containing protein [Nitrospiraceae bacterium]|nr:MAG: methyltransferase domain-containing protein [Nitrospiraceae bacterium]
MNNRAKNQKKLIWHAGAWSGNFGDNIIQQSIADNLRALSEHHLEFKYINCQKTTFTKDVISEMNREADLFLLGGGGLVFYRPQDGSTSGWQFNIDFDLIDKIKVPFVVYGVGFNKFEYDNNDFLPITNKHLVKTVEKATLFSVRNAGTKRELINRGCDGRKIEVIPDSGMFLESKDVIIPGLKEDRLKVAVNWTTDRENQSFPDPWEENRDAFIKDLIYLLKYLRDIKNAQIIYVGHMGGDFDRGIIRKLRDGLGEGLFVTDEEVPFLYPAESERAKALAGIYKKMDLVLGMRGHANIVSFGQHVPFIPIGSHRKNRYFIEDIGEPQYILDARNEIQINGDRMIRIVERLLNEKHEYMIRHCDMYRQKSADFMNFNRKVLALLDVTYEKCPFCDNESDLYTRTNRYEIYRDVVRCRVCDLIYLSPIVRGKEHERLYSENYRKLYECPNIPDEKFHNVRMPASLSRMDLIKEHVIDSGNASLLDIGCGGGTFLSLLRRNGFNNIRGAEIEPNYAKYVRENEGIEVFPGTLEMIPRTPQYDVVTMWHVLEHVSDLSASLSVVRKLIKDNGWFFVEVPAINNIESLPKDEVTFQIAHNFYFTPKTLKLVMANAGFRIIDARKTSADFYVLVCKKDVSKKNIKVKKILFVSYLQRHLKKMIPVIRELEKRPDIDLNVLLLTKEEWELADRYGIRYQKFDDYTQRKRTKDFDLAWGLEPLMNAIDTVKPDLFMAIEVNYILRNAVHHCKELGIKTLIVQHGTPNKYSLHAFAPFEGDCFAAWGDFTRDFLVENGTSPSKVTVTGGPVFDRTLALKPDRKDICAKVGVNPGHKIILFTTQGQGPGNCPSSEEIETAIIQTCKSAAFYPDVQLLFQIHPSQEISDVQAIAEKVGTFNARVIKYHDTESLIAVSDGVITFFSTTAIDALILDKPLMLINLSDDKDFYPFVRMQSAYGAYTEDEIQKAFRLLVENPDGTKKARREAVAYVAHKMDGKSLERAMDLIECL